MSTVQEKLEVLYSHYSGVIYDDTISEKSAGSIYQCIQGEIYLLCTYYIKGKGEFIRYKKAVI